MTDDAFVAELAKIEKKSRTKLDDHSIGFLARIRGVGLLQDDEWAKLKGFLRDALEYLRRGDKTLVRGKQNKIVLCLDADPRNADWIRIVRANNLAGYRLPTWAALWLWWLRTDSSTSFWKDVGRIAKQMGFDRMSEPTDKSEIDLQRLVTDLPAVPDVHVRFPVPPGKRKGGGRGSNRRET
jgi:hypothetical protein